MLDLGGLAFVDVAGARALDQTYKLLQAGCPVILRAPRGGLAGLAERVQTVDGKLQVSSPPGGPTVVTVELPSHS